MPRVLPVLTVAALALALVGCASEPAPEPSATDKPAAATHECVDTGAVADAVKVEGDLGAAPTVSFGSPITVDATQRRVVTAGDGDKAEYGSIVEAHFSIYNGTTGASVTASDYTGAPVQLTLRDDQVISGLVKTLNCSTAGSRVVGVLASDDAFGDTGNSQLSISPGDPLVIVADVISVFPPAVPGTWTTDVPAVTRAADGTPTVTLPKTDPPTELKLTVLTQGDGAVVGDGDNVTVDYQGISWDTGEIFDQSFGKSPASFTTTGVVAGFGAALVGQKVGSTVLVVIPPIYAYGTDPAAAELGGQTLVFLIDIKDTAAAG